MTNKYIPFITISSLIVFAVTTYALNTTLNAQILITTPYTPVSATTSKDTHLHTASAKNALSAMQAPQGQATTSTTSPQHTPNITFNVASTSYRIYTPEGSTVLDAMRALASTNEFTFIGKEYSSLGFFVDSINDVKNAGGYYWFLYVNGNSSDTGASETHLKAGDVVEWRYKKNY